MSSLLQDVRYSLRSFTRNPGFTAAAILTLAIALGANTAVFSVMNGVLLRALPYPEPDRIVDISILMPPAEDQPGRKVFLDSQLAAAWQNGTRTLERVAAYQPRAFLLTGLSSPERLTGARVSVTLLPLLRVHPIWGRNFAEAEQRPGSGRVVLLGHGLWQRHFQGDTTIVGKSVTLDGLPHMVIGVMPESFYFPRREVELWVPLESGAPAPIGVEVIEAEYLPWVARLRDGVSLEQAEAEARALLRGVEGEGPAEEEALAGRVRLVPWREEMVAEVRPALLALAAAVGLVLFIACINLANLLLARSSSRRREMAIRNALGSGRARLVRQMLTESTVLSLAGGIAGILVAVWLHLLFPILIPQDLPFIEEIRLDTRVYLFAFSLAALTGLLFGLLPAFRSAGPNLALSLRAGQAETSQGSASRGLLVVTEVALAFVLLVGASLLLRSFLHQIRIELGYEPDQVLTATLDLNPARYGSPGRSAAFFDGLLSRLGGRPEVTAAGVVSFPPLTPTFSLTSVTIVGQPPGRTLAIAQMTSPGYLKAMGLQLVEGRWLTAQEHAAQAPVAMVNQSFVRRHLANPRAVGQWIQAGTASLEIVGVLQDVRLLGPDSEPKPELFTSFYHGEAIAGAAPQRLTLVVRTSGAPAAFLPDLRALLLGLDPELVPIDVRTLEGKLSDSVAQPRFYATLLTVFAGLALMLALVGVYGVLSYAVGRQTRAIGVRRALGAQRWEILALEFRKGFFLVMAGLVMGLGLSLGATRAVSHLLFGVTARDPLSYAAAALSLAIAASFACYLPARRAMQVNPVEALRHDG